MYIHWKPINLTTGWSTNSGRLNKIAVFMKVFLNENKNLTEFDYEP